MESRAGSRRHEIVIWNHHVERGLQIQKQLKGVNGRKSGVVEIFFLPNF
jgi:hypothetical protein